jgi:hypothetical protein
MKGASACFSVSVPQEAASKPAARIAIFANFMLYLYLTVRKIYNLANLQNFMNMGKKNTTHILCIVWHFLEL